MIAESVTHADLLLRYPSALPSLEYLLEAIPAIKPRLYSIASSMSEVGNSVELCIILNDWETSKGETKYGLCTTYMKDLKAGDMIGAKMNKGGCVMPEYTDSILSVALGSGVSPVRSLC